MLKYDNHFKLNSQHNLKETRTIYWAWESTFHIELDIHMSSENYGESGYGLDLDLLTISC